MKRNKGSSTVFCILVFSVISILFLTLNTLLRHEWQKSNVASFLSLAVEAEYGKYYYPLFNHYSLFYYMDLEEDRMEASVLEFFQRNISDTPACRNIKPIQLYIEDKLYATDSPENIKKQMISAAKYSLGETIAQQITKEDRSMLEEMDEVEVCMEEASEIAEEYERYNEVNEQVMELLRLVEGVRIIKDKIVVEDSYVKRGVYGETIASNLGIDSKVIWEHLRENVFNIKDGLEEIESIAHLGVQGKKVGVSARQLKAWFGEIVSIYETTQLAYKAAVALEESLGHLGEIKTILKHNNFSGILKENAKCLEQCLGLQREKWPSTISEWEFLFDEVKQVKDAFRSYNTKELSFHYQQLFSMSEQEQAPLIEKDIDGMISYIVEDCESLSSKSIYEARVFESLQDETKKRGTSEGILLSAYIQQFFSHYSREECFDGSALRYEQEYIIAGKESDVDNIREVARQILQLRMGIAFLALVKDSEASSMAYATAASCVGFTGVEPIIKGMQYTILGVWAYEEACIDTAIILGGGRLPIQKRGDEFHVGYTELASFNKEMVQLKKKQYIGDKGVTYDKYLGILLLLQDEKVRVYRSMDLIQLNLSKSYSDLFSFQHALYSSRCYIYCTDGLEANTYYCY